VNADRVRAVHIANGSDMPRSNGTNLGVTGGERAARFIESMSVNNVKG